MIFVIVPVWGLSRNQAENIPRWLCLACLGRSNDVLDPVAVESIDLVEYISQCRNNRKPLKIIPESAAFYVVDALQKLLDKVIRDKSEFAWGKLFSN